MSELSTGEVSGAKKTGFAGNNGFREMLKLGAILAIYAAAACVGLAFVYAGTAKVIAQRQEADLEAAIKELFPAADDFEPIADIGSPDPAVTINAGSAFVAMKNGGIVGVALETSRAAYGGVIRILVGVGTDGRISGVKILEHSETPGLGANAGSSTYYVDRTNEIHFYDQFIGKMASDPFVPKQDVIAITAATVTSRAVSESVKAAGEAASIWFAKGGAR